MKRRTKIMVICGSIDKERAEYLEWTCVLDEHLGKKAKGFLAERRIETPYAIIDFVALQPAYTSGYKIVLKPEEDDERILRLATGTGEEVLEVPAIEDGIGDTQNETR